MDETPVSTAEAEEEAQVSNLQAAEGGRLGTYATLNLNELQALAPSELEELCRRMEVRIHPGRTRHHQILDLVRGALNRQIPVSVEGFFDQVADSFALLRFPALNFLPVPEDVGVPRAAVQRFRLRPGQHIAGKLRLPREREKTIMLEQVTAIEGFPAEEWQEPKAFDDLTPLYPAGRIMLENTKTKSISARAVDLLTPLGKGQRGLIVAAPRVGKTILLKEIAKAIRINHPEIVLIILLVDERPEEVTDLQREVDCQIYNSTFDENSQRHIQVAELVLERAKRLVEQKKDVVVLLDSITRLARGYNSLQSGKGRTMSGGVEAKALLKPKRFFGAARNVEEGGSLTILATALVDTGSKMDQVIFEEFKGTGNMELHLDRALVEKRLYPAIHVQHSATRREDLLYHPEEWERVKVLRKAMAAHPPIEAMEMLIGNLEATTTNAELLLAGLR
ncbi:MAG: transcription termination factor Rho [Verrucomicrobiota bacterium]|nr:transcription termination factor Rho [Verrucomicrobiota bacterium]